MTRDLKVLERHFRHWRKEGLLSSDQETSLRRASEELDRGSAATIVRAALAILGGGLLLAGLILVTAENWQALPRGLKLGGWALLQLGFLLAADHLGRRWPDRPYLAEAVTLVAGGWVLGGIALVSQIYHLDARPPNGIWLWLLLVMPGAWLLGRRAISAVVFVALVWGFALEVVENDSWVRARETYGPWLWIGIPLLAAVLTSWLPKKLPSLNDWVGIWVFAGANFFLLVLGAEQILDSSSLGRAWGLALAGLLLALVLTKRTLPHAWPESTARLVLLTTFLPWVVMGSHYNRGELRDQLAIGLSWIAQFVVAVLMIRAGARAGSRAWVNLGYLAVVAGILTRYFDFFGDYLEGGAALALTGFLLLFVLYALEKARRRTIAKEVSG